MKTLLSFVVISFMLTSAYSQKSIDALFAKYAGKDGFTTVTVNGNLLKLAECFGGGDSSDDLPGDIAEIRILTQEDDNASSENFYDLVVKDLDLSQYEEFMNVKEANQNVKMLVRTDGKVFKEFLLISGGEDNALIQIKGTMNLEDAKKFSSDAKKNHGADISLGSN